MTLIKYWFYMLHQSSNRPAWIILILHFNCDNINNNLSWRIFVFTKNCNFTEVGEPFAEQPLAVAVQQGSHLVKLISKTILELQKERYFEQLTSKKKDVALEKVSEIIWGKNQFLGHRFLTGGPWTPKGFVEKV